LWESFLGYGISDDQFPGKNGILMGILMNLNGIYSDLIGFYIDLMGY
jgi:hypothetical protein